MLKKKITTTMVLLIFISSFAINKKEQTELPCRATCTVTIPDGFGGSIGITATAGNIFTGCGRAGDRACSKALRKAIAMVGDL